MGRREKVELDEGGELLFRVEKTSLDYGLYFEKGRKALITVFFP